MKVVDCSAIVEALVSPDASDELLDLLEDDLHAPALLDVKVASTLRGLVLGKRLRQAAAEAALDTYLEWPIVRHSMTPLMRRVWQLRHRFTSYDATYLALAEALRVPLVTCDAKLRGGSAAQVIFVAQRP